MIKNLKIEFSIFGILLLSILISDNIDISLYKIFNDFSNSPNNRYFKEFKDLIFHGKNFKDIEKAHKEKKTAVFFGFPNCSPIGSNIGLVEEIHKLGIVFM